jgi:ZIP family zinc transporter
VENFDASLGWGLVIGGSLVVGAIAAARVRLPDRGAATLTAFGGGILLAAVALELVPEADREAGAVLTAVGLLSGTLVYVGAEWWLGRDEQMMAMRRSGHAAAAGRRGPRLRRRAASRSPSGCSSTASWSRSPWD